MALPLPTRPFSTFRFEVSFTQDANTTFAAQTSMAQAVEPGMGFSEVSGLEANIEVKAHPEGGRPQGVRQLIGRTTYPNLVLKRGMCWNLETWRWFAAVSSGVRPVPRKDMTIKLLDTDPGSAQKPALVMVTWKVVRAVPVKLKASDLNGKTGEVAIEELHLAHEGLNLVLPAKETA
jgi:phage tail-like protein